MLLNNSHEILVHGDRSLSCSVDEFGDSVFSGIEGFGDVTGSRCKADGWSIKIEFDSPNCFMSIIHAVLAAVHEHEIEAQSVTVSVRGRCHKLVDLL